MIITKDNIGDIICEYSSGERFLVDNIADRYLYRQEENGENTCIIMQEIAGGIETDEARIDSFHSNVALAKALEAAEMAALRRLVPGQYDSREQQQAARVLEIVDDQRSTFLSRLRQERSTTRAGCGLAEQFLEELNQQGPGTTGVFFGEPVTCMQQGLSFTLCGTQCLEREAAKAYLSECTPAVDPWSVPLDVRLASAFDRVSSQQSVPESVLEKSL